MPGLPVYKCVIDEGLETDLQVEYISLVDKPAIEKTFHAFNQAKLKFAVDEERRIVSGPAMLADMLIYRNDENLGEYYTVFDKQTILSIVQKFFKKGFGQNFNIMHNPDQKTDGVTVYESFITDEARGIKPMKGFEDAADGSWFITAKVYDEAIWQKVKSGEVKGFSVEGIFKQIPIRPEKLTPEQAYAKIEQILWSTLEHDDFGGPGSGRNPGGGGSNDTSASSIKSAMPDLTTMQIGGDRGYRETGVGETKGGEKVTVSKQNENLYRIAIGGKIWVATDTHLETVLTREGVTKIEVVGKQSTLRN